jgi:ectoine hydroxylase
MPQSMSPTTRDIPEECLHHRLIPEERIAFDRDGFLILPDVLGPETVSQLIQIVDRIDAQYRKDRDITADKRLSILDVIGEDPLLLALLDLPQTFGRVVDILGPYIQLYHSHLVTTPPDSTPPAPRLGWHQDSGRLNADLETNPRPRVSIKVGFLLTDTAGATDKGNFHVVPGSHLDNRLRFPADKSIDHPDSLPVQASAGAAVFFDRRLWHAAGNNGSNITRKAIFYGYSYRWLRPRDDMTVAHYLPDCGPIRQQLLGVSHTGGFGYTSPSEEDVPLAAWWQERTDGA